MAYCAAFPIKPVSFDQNIGIQGVFGPVGDLYDAFCRLKEPLWRVFQTESIQSPSRHPQRVPPPPVLDSDGVHFPCLCSSLSIALRYAYQMLASLPSSVNSAYDRFANPLLLDQLMAPADDILGNYVRNIYREGPLNDFKFLRCGIQRTLGQGASGRDFIQTHRQVFKEDLARSSFFDSLHSPRRREMLAAVNTELVLRSTGRLEDLLGRFPELRNRPLFAVDGHHIKHATHSPADAEGDYVSANSLYVLCLHSGLLFNLGAVQGDGVRHHEMPVFRQLIGKWLRRRGGKRRGPKPIFAGDPGFVDKEFWTRMALAQDGIEIITRAKVNMNPTVLIHSRWDPAHPANEGVEADLVVQFPGGSLMRMIRYRDPETGAEYEFLTTVSDLAPGLIALIYLMRWRIEKVFDTGKNKLEETKAWAVGEVAQDIRAHFFALTHNLLVMLRRQLEVTTGIREEKVVKKRGAAMKQREIKARESRRKVAGIQRLLPAVVQMTAQFIRTLRNGIVIQMRWHAAIEPLRTSMNSYL